MVLSFYTSTACSPTFACNPSLVVSLSPDQPTGKLHSKPRLVHLTEGQPALTAWMGVSGHPPIPEADCNQYHRMGPCTQRGYQHMGFNALLSPS